MTVRSTGSRGEMAAALFLQKKGYTIECMNYHSRFGEIDIIATDGSYTVFVEVKTRTQGAKICARESVDVHKRKRILRTAMCYLGADAENRNLRFDVVEVYIKNATDFEILKINHIENAFDAEGV